MHTRTVVIKNTLGLHARAAAKLVQTAARYASEVELTHENGQSANAKSIMGVMMLAASQGTKLALKAAGKDAPDALDAIVHLVEGKFGEAE